MKKILCVHTPQDIAVEYVRQLLHILLFRGVFLGFFMLFLPFFSFSGLKTYCALSFHKLQYIVCLSTRVVRHGVAPVQNRVDKFTQFVV